MASNPRARAAGNARANATGMSMVVALLVLLVPVVLISLVFTRNPEPPIPVVAYEPVAERAAEASAFTIWAPTNLPEGWRCTQASWLPAGTAGRAEAVVGDTWSLAFLTPDDRYIGLDQRAAAPELFVEERTREGAPDGESVVSGRAWTRYLSDDGRTRSLVRADDSVVVVSADLPYEALEAFAGTLAPVG
ncbi:DUF4245 domain-containing protein [Propioniciclava soli]|uniref:DUF4245 domain-containing protein n=1 Tax=Propioniciclava soli TaxID=2775081 RepID=UPI001E32634E|nr:DUF4245 domain-containing protein [Propioniciclava soli]